MIWAVGQRVGNRPDRAKVYEGTPWFSKMRKPRNGTIVELPLFIRCEGQGTMLVHWDSLTGDNSDLKNWQRWVHSESVTAKPHDIQEEP